MMDYRHEPWKHDAKLKKLATNDPTMWSVHNRQAQRNRKQSSGCQGPEVGKEMRVNANRYSFWSEENALELDSSDVYVILWIRKKNKKQKTHWIV